MEKTFINCSITINDVNHTAKDQTIVKINMMTTKQIVQTDQCLDVALKLVRVRIVYQ